MRAATVAMRILAAEVENRRQEGVAARRDADRLRRALHRLVGDAEAVLDLLPDDEVAAEFAAAVAVARDEAQT